MRARYEHLRELVLAGQAGGWRHGLGVLSARGMAAWITAWAALPIQPQVSAGAGTTSQADSVPVHFDPVHFDPVHFDPVHFDPVHFDPVHFDPVPDRHRQKGGVEPACVVFPPSAMPQIVAVLAQLTLAHARRATDAIRDCQEDRPP